MLVFLRQFSRMATLLFFECRTGLLTVGGLWGCCLDFLIVLLEFWVWGSLEWLFSFSIYLVPCLSRFFILSMGWGALVIV